MTLLTFLHWLESETTSERRPCRIRLHWDDYDLLWMHNAPWEMTSCGVKFRIRGALVEPSNDPVPKVLEYRLIYKDKEEELTPSS